MKYSTKTETIHKIIYIASFLIAQFSYGSTTEVTEGYYHSKDIGDSIFVSVNKNQAKLEYNNGSKMVFYLINGSLQADRISGENTYTLQPTSSENFIIIETDTREKVGEYSIYALPGLFKKLLSILVSSALLFSIMQAYLKVNKIWKRRKNEEVASSISIVAALLGFAVGVPFLLNNIFITNDYFSAGKVVLGLSLAIIFTLIGAGVFVEANRGKGFFTLFAEALNLEKKESGELLNAMLRPKGAQKIINILTKLAAIDDDIAQEEIDLINDFAEKWHIDIPTLKVGKPEQVTNLVELKELVQSYLDEKPDLDVASGLTDLINLMAEADDEVTDEESMAIAEFTGMISHYISVEKGGDITVFDVNIVPQGEEQIQSVREILPDLEPTKERSGTVFKVGSFFSEAYAEAVCEKYIALGLYTDTNKTVIPARTT